MEKTKTPTDSPATFDEVTTNQWVSLAEAATLLGVAQFHLRRLIQRGTLRARDNGHTVEVPAVDLADLAERAHAARTRLAAATAHAETGCLQEAVLREAGLQ